MTDPSAPSDRRAVRKQLDAFTDRALAASTHSAVRSWGPLSLELCGETAADRDDILRYLSPGRGSWPLQRVITVSSASIPMEALPAELQPTGSANAMYRDDDVIAIASGHEHSLWVMRSDINTAIRWVTTAGDVPLWEQLSPLRAAARWIAAANQSATVHCGAVGNEHGAVLLVGDAGAGKSTTSMACLGSTLDVLGDDFCFVDASKPTPVVDAMYRLAKLDDRSLELLPHLRERVVGTGLRGKSLIELDPLTVTGRPIRALCHVVRDHTRPTGIEPISRMETLRAAAPSTMFQVRLAEQETWATLAATVRSVQTRRLHVDRVDEAPERLAELLASVAASGA